MGFTYSHDLGRKTFSAGARQPALELIAPEGGALQRVRLPGIEEGYSLPFAPSGASVASRGNGSTVTVKQLGEGRVALLLRAHCFQQLPGHTPKVWKVSSAKTEGGLLFVAEPGFRLEIAAYKRPWRRFEVTHEGLLVEVDQAEEVID